ncbi:MAG: outer membrane protein assembly factor BamE [Methylococcaceae bacterium]|nr:outer membrane protein assembly factor BamE [Methylococcaceae bacterium]
MRKFIYPIVLISSITLSGCSTIMNNLPGVYTLDIQQGNIISQEVIDQLRPKMTKRQVLYIMGSSMLVDVFHQKRWDYLYSEQLGGKARKQKRLSLFFDGDELIGVQGDYRPSTLPVIKISKETTIEVPPRNLEKTLWEKITGLFSDDEPTTPEVTEASEDQQEKEPETES